MGYAVGVLDVKGRFKSRSVKGRIMPVASVIFSEYDLVARVAGFMGCRVWVNNTGRTKEVQYRASLTSEIALDFMEAIYPHLIELRQVEIEKVLTQFRPESEILRVLRSASSP